MTILDDKIAAFFRPEILKLNAYHVPSAEEMVKLDAMENPYHWPPEMVEAWLDRLRNIRPNRYPDPQPEHLKHALKIHAKVPENMEILLGNGSDEIIQILLMALAGKPEATVMTPQPTFVMYQQLAVSLGLKCIGVPLQKDFSLDREAMLSALDQYRPQIVFLAYPNNPSGNLFDEKVILEIIEKSPGLVILDEAYAPFAQASFMERLSQFDNLLVMRTLSKLGLAGLRLGFLAGRRAWLEQLDKLRLPYNINVLTQITAEFALANAAVFEQQTAQIRSDRTKMYQQLQNLPQVEVFPSAANFILFRVPDADTVFHKLKQQGILIKNLHPSGGLLTNCLRVTIGTPGENEVFLTALKTALTP